MALFQSERIQNEVQCFSDNSQSKRYDNIAFLRSSSNTTFSKEPQQGLMNRSNQTSVAGNDRIELEGGKMLMTTTTEFKSRNTDTPKNMHNYNHLNHITNHHGSQYLRSSNVNRATGAGSNRSTSTSNNQASNQFNFVRPTNEATPTSTMSFPTNNPTINPTILFSPTVHSYAPVQPQLEAPRLSHVPTVQQLHQIQSQTLNQQPFNLSMPVTATALATTPPLVHQQPPNGIPNVDSAKIPNVLNLQQPQLQQILQQQHNILSDGFVNPIPIHQNASNIMSMPTALTATSNTSNIMPPAVTTLPTIPITTAPTSVTTNIPQSIHLPTPSIGLTVQDHPLKNPVYNGVNPKYPNLHVLNQNPPIFTVTDFLTSTECDFLINVAQDCFTPAPVVGKGGGEVSPSRTSSTCYLAREDLPRYLAKVSLLTGKPIEHCELPQVGRYFPSQQYLQHFDAFDLSNEDGIRFASNGGQRTVTVLVYLNNVERGGHTSFPNLNLDVQPKKGMALVFFPSTVDGFLDKNALHAAKPAIDTKYVSQVWIRQGRYDGVPSKRMFSSVDQAMIVQKSLIAAREGNDAVDDLTLLNAALSQ